MRWKTYGLHNVLVVEENADKREKAATSLIDFNNDCNRLNTLNIKQSVIWHTTILLAILNAKWKVFFVEYIYV